MDKEKKYNLKNDIIFKAFFARKGNEEFLIDFLQALLGIKISEIDIKEEVNLEQLAPIEKGGRLDLQAKLNDGVIVNIELQMKNHYNIEPRSVTYASKVIARETSKGTKYEDIKNVIMINILGYDLFDFDEYISRTKIVLDKHRDYEAINTIQWYFIELKKFRNQNPDMNDKVNQWLALIDDEREEWIQMAEKKNKTLVKARKEINYLTGDAAVRRLAELREDWETDYESGLSYARKEGKEEGLKEGKKEGLKEGKIEGERDEKIKTAKKLIKLKLPIEQIAEITELPVEEVKKIKDNLIK